MTLKLPIGIQDFKKLRTENYLYIDKTQFIYRMITEGAVYFLSRPRRFGKSLLVSTLEQIFLGNKELFEGLWIDESDYNWNQYPILKLDMASLPNYSIKSLAQNLIEQLLEIADYYKVEIKGDLNDPSNVLRKLIIALSVINPVVVLIDEYDKPIIDQIENSELVKKNLDLLRHFYGILKTQDRYLKFVFLTGITKFSKVSVFSGLNNLNNVSLLNNYATILGYTQTELEVSFKPWLQQLCEVQKIDEKNLLNKIQYWYNGYRFAGFGETVYNPFSTLLLFNSQEFLSHWFATGTPSFLLKLIDQEKFNIMELENIQIDSIAFDAGGYEVDQLKCLPIFYQAGYLTIKNYNSENNIYTLGYPNYEVGQAFLSELLQSAVGVNKLNQKKYLNELSAKLEEHNFSAWVKTFNQLLAQVPYDFFLKEERYYQTLVYLVLTLIGYDVNAEVHTHIGRIDAIVELPTEIFIFEFKCDKSARDALKQIKERNYSAKYQGSGKIIYAVGINFNTKRHCIDDHLFEQISLR